MGGQKNVLNQIAGCKRCPLHQFQKPLLDNTGEADVIWVGLSAVKVQSTSSEIPLGKNTNSGKLISQIERKNSGVQFYKTNLVKCLPWKNDKIRYPKKEEMNSCSSHLDLEISALRPKLVFLLGKQVGDFLTDTKKVKLSDSFNYAAFSADNTLFVPVHHPSYILVYKRKQLDAYVEGISRIISNHFESREEVMLPLFTNFKQHNANTQFRRRVI